ncbi:MAG TPA: hypothetical protein PKX08_19345 [Cyclobacteriaceae bacterium]|nr:hypothetical protein [Cyclobacteriaceae bacterium]
MSLRRLRERVWPLAIKKNLATDMTGVSLPILNYPINETLHPHQVTFLLYYSVPEIKKPNKITKPYTSFSFDLQSGDLVSVDVIRSREALTPLVGFSASTEIFELPDDDRRNLQNLFFTRCDEIAQIYAGKTVSTAQAAHLLDLLNLFETFIEPPLASDYETYGKPFFSWLRAQTKNIG